MVKKVRLIVILLIGLLLPVMINAETITEQHSDSKYKLVIEDDINIFTEEDFESIKQKMVPISSKCNVVLKTTMSSDLYDSVKVKADERYNQLFGTDDGFIILINVYNAPDGTSGVLNNMNSLAISTFGSLNNTITSEEVLSQTWNNTPKVKVSNYTEAVDKILHYFGNKTGVYKTDAIVVGKLLHIEDDADLLTPEEEKKLVKVMSPLTEYGYIIFKSIASNDYMSTSEFANNYYYKNFGNDSGTMFLIDMDNRQIYIVSGGMNYNVITKRKALTITDNTYKYASNEDYYGCAEEAFKEMEVLLHGGKIAEPMRHISNVVISLVLGFLLTFLYIASTMRIKKASHKDILDSTEKYVAIANLSVIPNGQRRVYSPVSSDSDSGGFSSGGGGGFSGGGGGGGFSGGGGGHGF